MIDVAKEHLVSVLEILKKHVPSYEVRVFGSRYKGTAKEYSDLDVVIMGSEKIPCKILYALKEEFEESNIPFRIDIIDWHTISPEFRSVIEKSGYEVIQKA